jgi:hypothetical protein
MEIFLVTNIFVLDSECKIEMTNNIKVPDTAHTHRFQILYISRNTKQLPSLTASALVDL